jgi:hypothetical protein
MQRVIENNPTSESAQCYLKRVFESLKLLFLKPWNSRKAAQAMPIILVRGWKFFSSKFTACQCLVVFRTLITDFLQFLSRVHG